MMFCPNCGADCKDANFCPECGADLRAFKTPAATQKATPEAVTVAEEAEEKAYPPLKEPYIVKINGQSIDLHAVIRTFGMGTRKIGAYSYLVAECKCSPAEAREILTPLYEYHKDEKVTWAESMVAQVEGLGPRQREKALKAQEEKQMKAQALKEKIAALEASGQVYCPKCFSTSISANQKGFGFVRGALGANLGLDVGMIAGGIGSKKLYCTCLKCGYKWQAGKK